MRIFLAEERAPTDAPVRLERPLAGGRLHAHSRTCVPSQPLYAGLGAGGGKVRAFTSD